MGSPYPFDVRGTAFQQRVWLALRQIPAGKTETYSPAKRSATIA
jgi:AraC family transcriptional regulator of adaptative response/methylated-DNA-[protein]-cysteine methyltransferase